ncbi:hypothetical protein AB0M36_08585 [Actinoplanes sp. NPDC051346]|uniref:hypothetical protein n=1 Tax=Actinoplanes sp. NPDC051346 TaxID=3155048 RepID=UPI003442B3C8
MSTAEQRVWAHLPEGTREALAKLPGTDLQTLLLSVARARAATVKPADLMRRWREDRFVRPAACDPRAVAAVEARIWQLLPAEFDGVELSPVVPLGTCSAVAPVSQNRIVATIRGSEVLSDASNALAVEAARRRVGGGEVHVAASHRNLRAQDFGAGRSAHFRLFTLVSSARDGGSGATEARLLVLHLGFWQRVLAELVPGVASRLHVTVMDSPVVRERFHDTVLPALTGAAAAVPVVEDPGRERGRGYYTNAALRITADDGTQVVELGDGGFTTWTGRLMNDAKERCLVSCLATERLAVLAAF